MRHVLMQRCQNTRECHGGRLQISRQTAPEGTVQNFHSTPSLLLGRLQFFPGGSYSQCLPQNLNCSRQSRRASLVLIRHSDLPRPGVFFPVDSFNARHRWAGCAILLSSSLILHLQLFLLLPPGVHPLPLLPGNPLLRPRGCPLLRGPHRPFLRWSSHLHRKGGIARSSASPLRTQRRHRRLPR